MRRRSNRKLVLIIRLGIVLFILGFFSIIFALIYSMNPNIISNIKINNMKVSGLSKTEAISKFEDEIKKIEEQEVILKHGDNEKKYTFKGMELETDIVDKINEACKIGRDGNIVSNNYRIVATLIKGENLQIDVKFNEEILKSIFSNLDDEWNETFVNNSYYIDGDKLVINKGKSGVVVNEEELRNALTKLVRDKIEGKDINEIEIPVIQKNPDKIDLEAIQKEIYKEAQNASYDANSSKLTVHSDGVDFGIGVEEAENIIKEDKEEYIVPLRITRPAITTDMLGDDAFPDVLASFSTRFDPGNTNRNTNMDLAAKALDGTVLMPGQRFSFNSIVGPTTASKGYLLAGAYSAGELVENYGGGICQVSSTIYNAVVYANLEIVERYNHSSVVSYVDPGRDATISYGSKDFKFLNSRNYAIKLNVRATNRNARSPDKRNC